MFPLLFTIHNFNFLLIQWMKLWKLMNKMGLLRMNQKQRRKEVLINYFLYYYFKIIIKLKLIMINKQLII